MNRIVFAGLAAFAAAHAAHASFIQGSPIATSIGGEVSIEFLSQDAGATGSLYFLAVERAGVITYQASTDGKNLGRFLFSNHGTPAGTMLSLGLFDAGDILHLAYRITHGAGAAKKGDVIRTDVSGGWDYFHKQQVISGPPVFSTVIGMEDIKNRSQSDWDYNDVVFALHAVPEPGTLALAATGCAMLRSRRRRDS